MRHGRDLTLFSAVTCMISTVYSQSRQRIGFRSISVRYFLSVEHLRDDNPFFTSFAAMHRVLLPAKTHISIESTSDLKIDRPHLDS